MNCKQAQNYIQFALDGELSKRRQRSLEKHLVRCESCRLVQDQFATLRGLTSQLARDSAPARLIPHSLDITYRRSPRWATVGAVAAALVFAIGTWRITTTFKQNQLANTDTIHQTPALQTLAAVEPKLETPPVRVEFSPDSNVLAIQRPSRHSNITIMWVYPTVKTYNASRDSQEDPESTPKGTES